MISGNLLSTVRDSLVRVSYYLILAFAACSFVLCPSMAYASVNDELIIAASEGNLARAKDLVARGADVNAKDKFSKTPLIQAASKGYAVIVEYLIGKRADVNAKDNSGRTPLSHAVYNGNSKIVTFLIENGADVNKRDNTGKTALFAAVRTGNVEILRLLIDKGAEIDVKGKRDYVTPLMEASERGHTEIAKILIEKGADINAKQITGLTSLRMAAFNLDTAMVKLLINSGANINAVDMNGGTILTALASVSYKEMMMGGAMSGTTTRRVRADMAKMVKLLLENGADPNIRDNDGKTALIEAKENRHSEIAKLLIQAGAKK